MKDTKTKEKFLELRAAGKSFDSIASELKTSKQTLIAWAKDLQTEISNLKAIELEKLQELYFMTKAERIKLFGEKLKSIKEELEKRNFADLSTERLLDYFVKYSEILKSEVTDPSFRGEEDFGESLTIRGREITWRA
ncbi:MAG: hypothetical protein MUE70_05500 [Desulfobacterales bacterium]|jgi:intein-encoded DNA endonuclease-like protein|nr:hypothetical protein [Desulfobacterales bacterium]